MSSINAIGEITQVELDSATALTFTGTNTDTWSWTDDGKERNLLLDSGSGWSLELDSGTPVSMVVGQTYNLPVNSTRRFISGSQPIKFTATNVVVVTPDSEKR